MRTLDIHPKTEVVAAHDATERVYAQTAEGILATFTADGRQMKEYALESRAIRQILPHPDGDSALVLTLDGLWWLTIRTTATPAPQHREETLRGPRRMVADAAVSSVNLNGATVVPDILWIADGDEALVLEPAGVLRRISVPTLVEKARLNIGCDCSELLSTALGPVVVVPALQELWLIDEASLAVRKRVTAAEVATARGAPGLSRVFLMPPHEQDVVRPRDHVARTVRVVDLRRDGVAAELPWEAIREQGSRPVGDSLEFQDLLNLTLTPDGRFGFCVSNGRIHRVDVHGTNLAPGWRTPRGIAPGALSVSADSLYVAAGTVTGVQDARPFAAERGVYVFGVGALAEPLMCLPGRGPLQDVCFDRAGERIYVRDDAVDLMTFTTQGRPLKEYALSTRGRRSRTAGRLYAHPRGRALFVLDESELHWVELPGRGDAISEGPDGFERRIRKTALPTGSPPTPFAGGSVRLLPSVAGPGKTTGGDCLFSQDGMQLFLCEGGQGVRRLDAPGFDHELRMESQWAVSSIALCKRGLLAAVPELQEVWLLDPETLALRRRMDVPRAGLVVSSPVLDLAFVALRETEDQVAVLNVESGLLVGSASSRQQFAFSRVRMREERENPIRRLWVAPDGRFLFAQCEQGLCRLAIEGSQLSCEEAHRCPNPPEAGVAVSADSSVIAVPGAVPNWGRNRQEQEPQLGINVFGIDDFHRRPPPVRLDAKINAFAYGGFDRDMFVLLEDNTLVLFDQMGLERGRWAPFADGDAPDPAPSLVPDPGGEGVVVRAGNGTWWVSLSSPGGS